MEKFANRNSNGTRRQLPIHTFWLRPAGALPARPRIRFLPRIFSRYASLPNTQIARYRSDAVATDFIFEAKRVAAIHLGVENRKFFLGRRWDMLYYLLSETRRRKQEKNWTHWVEKALFGSEVLHAAVVTTIGIPIRYLQPAELPQILDGLENTSAESLRQHWNPPAMSQAAVYKIHGEENEDVLQYLIADLEDLKTFYAEAARHNEGVLAFIG